MASITEAFKTSPQFLEPVPKEKLLPVPGKKNVLITAALPYVNNVPHLGNLIGCVLSADVFARYCRMKGYQTLYICGTDEYGTATETKALQEGVTPKALCDKYHEIHKAIYEWFNIEFDNFGRTTTQNHTEVTQDIFMQLHKNGFTTADSIDQLFCETCNMFLADRFVSGICNLCGFDDARGDQCDACGKLINAVELKQPKCHMCKKEPVVRKSTHIFLQLDKLQDEIQAYVEKEISKSDTKWSANAIAIVKGWFKNGLERRCITRDLKWGIPVPIKEYDDKVFYVWFDAPIGYFSITKSLLKDDWLKWWKNPDDVQLYQFVGKDNVVFHGVMFPCTLLGTKNGYTVVNHLCATEYLNYEDTKFSKSRGTGVFGDGAKGTGIEADVWRFYLIYMRPENQDSAFAWDDFAFKVNSELLANLGNFVNRALTFVTNFFESHIPEMHLENDDVQFLKDVHNETVLWDETFDKVKLRDSIKQVLAITRHGNAYLQVHQPWVLVKGDEAQRKRAGTIIGVAANVSYHVAVLLHPVMPEISKRIREQCGLPELPLFSPYVINYLKPGHKIQKIAPLFKKIEPDQVKALREKFGGGQEKGPAKPGEKPDKKAQKKEKPQTPQDPSKLAEKEALKEAKKEAKRMEASRIFPNLAKNQTAIQQLLRGNWAKFEKARDLFVARKLAEFEKERVRLEKEVESLKTKLFDAETAAGGDFIFKN
ncbi:hypothetical protein WR25_15695 isoform B [Diploscapter pachys]|uniref:Methionine--tRNA ligase, cytoplasmic n=1 Tax=Diploscapter pachys TaxID=2018661 RepID=A0A2A2J396_9BILA|nr:hypothetical protein WR25_15695 isoform B [Diploscapter pachys]